MVLDLPIESIHPFAFRASLASHCADDQGKFQEMRQRLYTFQRQLEPWDAHAQALGLDVDAFTACLESATYADAVRSDMAEAQKVGISGTPAFILGLTDPEDPTKVEGLSFISGAQPFARFQLAIEKALQSLEEKD